VRLLAKVFFANLAAVAVVAAVVLVSVRNVAIRAVAQHMGMMTGSMAEPMVKDLQRAIAGGLDDAMLVGIGAALLIAVATSLVISTLITRPIRKAALAAEGIAAGDYGHRVEYAGRDEIAEFANSFNEMAAKLEETEALRRQLLATVSHELRTPLTSIQGYMEGLIDGVVPEEPETYRLVQREAARLTRLVEDIERLSRLEAGVEVVRPVSLPAGKVVTSTAEGLRPLFEDKGVRLELDLPTDLPPVWADRDKLSQILVNLLVNSLKYTEPGGLVTIAVKPSGELLRFSVKDSGIGIPPQDLPHVFERFYRVDRSRSSGSGGTGIGLAVVKTLVERMDGRVYAASTLGAGTEVWFTMKAAPLPPGSAD
jgi:two-component system, OmpR family, sensor histidine kinase BaeS